MVFLYLLVSPSSSSSFSPSIVLARVCVRGPFVLADLRARASWFVCHSSPLPSPSPRPPSLLRSCSRGHCAGAVYQGRPAHARAFVTDFPSPFVAPPPALVSMPRCLSFILAILLVDHPAFRTQRRSGALSSTIWRARTRDLIQRGWLRC